MGQYQEWLHAQEFDKRLKTEVEALEREILYLKERITTLEQAVPETENVIVQALQAYLSSQAQSPETAGRSLSAQTGQSELPGWVVPQTPIARSAAYFPSIPGMFSQKGRLPGDMLAFFEDNRKRGLLLRQQIRQSGENEEHPVDAETERLNENIQRWFERWHRETAGMAQMEVQDGQ